MRGSLFLVLAVLLAAPAGIGAQSTSDSPLARFKTEPLSLGLLLETAGDFQTERTFSGESGFSVRQFRIRLDGRLEGSFSYLFQTSFGDALDARLSWHPSPQVTVSAGRFKVPFSGEFLLSPVVLEFARRAQTVRALRPGRAVGAHVQLNPAGLPIEIRYGVYNADGSARGNGSGDFTHSARAVTRHDVGSARFEVGGGFAVNNLEASTVGDGEVPSFSDVRRLLGVDTRLENDRWLFSAEAVWGDARSEGLEDPSGGQVTVGLHVQPRTTVLVRFDAFDTGARAADGAGPAEDRHLIVLGLRARPTDPMRFRVNLQLPTSGYDGKPRLVATAQLAL